MFVSWLDIDDLSRSLLFSLPPSCAPRPGAMGISCHSVVLDRHQHSHSHSYLHYPFAIDFWQAFQSLYIFVCSYVLRTRITYTSVRHLHTCLRARHRNVVYTHLYTTHPIILDNQPLTNYPMSREPRGIKSDFWTLLRRCLSRRLDQTNAYKNRKPVIGRFLHSDTLAFVQRSSLPLPPTLPSPNGTQLPR